jgi:TolB-like protein
VKPLPALVPVALLAACSVGGLYEDYPEVRVDIFDNVSERRTHEFDFTDAVVQEMASRGIRVNKRNAPYTLKGRILDLRTPSVVDQARTDVVLVGSLKLHMEIWLVDNRTGATVWKDDRVEAVTFSTARGESFQSARQEMIDRVARWVVTHFEKEW